MSISVDYMITAKCNLACPFCYGPDPKMRGEINLSQKLDFVDYLAERGVKRIIIAGGEPLISVHLEPVLQRASQSGLEIAVQTNGFSLKKIRQIAPLLEWLALPIDASNLATHLFMRTTEKQSENTINSAVAGRHVNPKLKIKIGTVVTKENISQIREMAPIIRSIKPDVWKLYEVRPRGAALLNYENLRVSRENLDRAILDLKTMNSDLNIHYSPCDLTARAYIIVNPDTECLIPDGSGYLSAGHLVAESGDIQDAVWDRALAMMNLDGHHKNVDRSFPGWMK